VASSSSALRPQLPPLVGTKVDLPSRPNTSLGTERTPVPIHVPSPQADSSPALDARDARSPALDPRDARLLVTGMPCGERPATSAEVWPEMQAQPPPRPHTSCATTRTLTTWSSNSPQKSLVQPLLGPPRPASVSLEMEKLSQGRRLEVASSSWLPRAASPGAVSDAPADELLGAYEKDWKWSALEAYLDNIGLEDLPEEALGLAAEVRRPAANSRSGAQSAREVIPEAKRVRAQSALGATTDGPITARRPIPARAQSALGGSAPVSSSPADNRTPSPTTLRAGTATATPSWLGLAIAPRKAFQGPDDKVAQGSSSKVPSLPRPSSRATSSQQGRRGNERMVAASPRPQSSASTQLPPSLGSLLRHGSPKRSP